MKLDLAKAKSALLLLGTSFFMGEENTLKDRFNLNHELIQEGLERLSELTKNNRGDLSPPAADCEISIEEDDDDEENEDAPIRIYKLNEGGWGFEMDIFKSGEKTDITMRGEFPIDFNEKNNIEFHMFEVM
ncbi:hypothetical protein [Paracidovorax oryzae]|uniref:hypothetical protein n=1 Tax=Paracidovorax oryzae TaxID=862720 RepID=UPI0012EB8413|nr:hypothetical protein [Paracidovorax oryzae]